MGFEFTKEEKTFLANDIKIFIGEVGVKYFKALKEEFGDILPVIPSNYKTDHENLKGVIEGSPIPHAIHFREGMQIRNRIRDSHYKEYGYRVEEEYEINLDDYYKKLIEMAIE